MDPQEDMTGGFSSESSALSSPRSSPPPGPFFTTVRPAAYMSPSPSQDSSAKASPTPENTSKRPTESDGRAEDAQAPAAKRRRTTEPKPRTTQYLNLLGDYELESPPQKSELDRLLKALQKKRKIVVIAGAGISVSAGIPDFRSSQGLFNTLKKRHSLKSSGRNLFDFSVYQNNEDTEAHHDMVRELYEKCKDAKPTLFHHLLATLAAENRLLRLYTQNVDGIESHLKPLETSNPLPVKAPWPRTIQLHGGLQLMHCCKCRTIRPFEPELFKGPNPPSCEDCIAEEQARDLTGKRSLGVGKLRPRMVLYNEHTNFDENAIGAVSHSDLRAKPDAVIVVGTTVKVPGTRRLVREMCKSVKDRKNGLSVWINPDSEPSGKDLEGAWDLVVRGTSDEVARRAAMRKWYEPEVEGQSVPAEYVEWLKKAHEVTVEIEARPAPTQNQTLTPDATPKLSPQLNINNEHETTPTKTVAANSTGKGSKASALTALTNGAGKASSKKKPTQKKATGKTTAKSTTKKAKASAKPNATIKFGASKPNIHQSSKESKLPQTPPRPSPIDVHQDEQVITPTRPGVSPASSDLSSVPSPMLPVSPNAAANNSLVFSQAEDTKFPNLLHRRLPPPIRSESFEQKKKKISPPSSPRGMENFID